MLTPEQYRGMPDKLVEIYRRLEDFIIGDISRRIAKAGTITDTAEWQLLKMSELGAANDDIKAEIQQITALSKKEVEQLFFDTGQISSNFYDNLYLAKTGAASKLIENPAIIQDIRALIKQTNQEFVNFTQSMGFAVKENGKTVFKPIAKAYQDALDFAQTQVSSGALDFNTAVRKATQDLADSGVRFVDYKTGWVNRADVAVRRAVQTGIGQITGKIAEQVTDDLDLDIVEVSAHSGARPDHAEWQGKWYSLSGTSKKYPSLVAVTNYGEGAGLKGWNCRHDFHPVDPEVSEPTYSADDLKNIDPPPFDYEGKKYNAYEATQFQRQTETAMRKTKREIIAAKESGDNSLFTAKSIKLREQKALYLDFSKQAGLYTQSQRTQVIGFDRSIAQKSVNAAKKGE